MKTAPRALFFALVVTLCLAFPAPARAGTASRGFWRPVEWALSSQRRMLQVGTVAVALAIYIIAWKK
jgi:hypothetical protein